MKKRVYETVLSYYRNTFEMDAPAPILTTDIVRKVGGYVDADFNLVTPTNFYEGLKVEQESSGSDIKQLRMSDWAMYGKLAWQNLQSNPDYYSDNSIEEERIRKFIRTEILGLDEAANRKVYIKPGESAPKGAKVSKGSRGGSYYYTKTTGKKGVKDLPGKPEKEDPDKIKDPQSFVKDKLIDYLKTGKTSAKMMLRPGITDIYKSKSSDKKYAVPAASGGWYMIDKESGEVKSLPSSMMPDDLVQTGSTIHKNDLKEQLKTESKHKIGDKVKFNKPLYNKAGRQFGQEGGKVVDIKNHSDGTFYIINIKGKKYQFPEKQLIKEVTKKFDGYDDMKKWGDKNKHKTAGKIRFDAVKQNYPNLTQDQMEEYGSMLLYPYHSSFSKYDLKNYFKKLSDSQAK